jgi:predicted NAD/FAD-binding protein
MIKINELNTSKSMLADLTDQEASSITGGAVNTILNNLNNQFALVDNKYISDFALAYKNLLAKITTQIAANNR